MNRKFCISLRKMCDMLMTKMIPYGLTDFERIRSKNFYYVDKTMFIEKIEQMPSYLFYFGLLSIKGVDELKRPILAVPNIVAREQLLQLKQ